MDCMEHVPYCTATYGVCVRACMCVCVCMCVCARARIYYNFFTLSHESLFNKSSFKICSRLHVGNIFHSKKQWVKYRNIISNPVN
jgi:hypothetical protein